MQGSDAPDEPTGEAADSAARRDGSAVEPARTPSRSIRRAVVLARGERRARWLESVVPVGVFLGVLAVFSAFAQIMHEQEDRRIALVTRLATDDVARRLEGYVRFRNDVLLSVKDAWVRGSVHDERSFHEHAGELRELLQGVVSLNWVDENGVIRWVEPEAGNDAAKDRDLTRHPVAGAVIRQSMRTGRPRLTPPLDLYQGGRGLAIYVPVIVNGRLHGCVNGAFRVDSMFRECLGAGVAVGHHVTVTDGGELVFERSDDGDASGVRYEASRRLHMLDREWGIVLRPTQMQIHASRTWADEVALVIGVGAAIALAWLSFRLTRDRGLIRTSRERYRSVVDDTPAYICRYLPCGTITFTNVAFARTLGASPRELVGTSIFDRLPRSARETTRSALEALDAQETSRVHELELETPDGSRIWQQWIDRALFDETGNVVEFQSVGLDVTALHRAQEDLSRSEERFRTIFNAVADGILLFEEDGELRDVNDRACALFGLGRAELLGRGIEALREAGCLRLDEWLAHASRLGQLDITDWKFRNANGDEWQAELELRRTTIAGQPRIAAVVRDVTARAQLAEQLRQSQKMEAMGTLAGGIAHDFNNILTAVMGHAEMARMTLEAGSREAASIDGIVTACQQATGVTRSLLTFSRRRETSRSTVDLPTLVRDTLRLLRPLLPSAIEITSEISTAEALWIDADPSQVQQVVMNLALNARDAMPDGGQLHVAVACESAYAGTTHLEESREMVVVSVSDTGVGMSPAVRRRVVEPFFTTKTRERGTGLGMSVVHGIVSSHGGSLEIESEEGEGTTVRVSFPRRGEPEFDILDAATEPRPAAATGARVLVVEDNGQVRQLLEAVLTERGYRVSGEHNGLAAYDLYRERGPTWDLLVLDIDLPGMTGTELLRRVRGDGDLVPAILISGNPRMAPDVDALGNARFLQKPFTMRELAAVAAEMAGVRAGS